MTGSSRTPGGNRNRDRNYECLLRLYLQHKTPTASFEMVPPLHVHCGPISPACEGARRPYAPELPPIPVCSVQAGDGLLLRAALSRESILISAEETLLWSHNISALRWRSVTQIEQFGVIRTWTSFPQREALKLVVHAWVWATRNLGSNLSKVRF